jgi:hypothetical protein
MVSLMANITVLPIVSSLATDTVGNVRVYDDYHTALNEFVIVPVADHFGITGEEVYAEFDTELIFSSVAEYESFNGREGFCIRRTLDDEAYLRTVEYQRS